MKSPVLSEIERQRQAEQHKKYLANEVALLAKFAPLPALDISPYREFFGPFLDFCAKRGVRHCPSRPATVAAYISDCAYRGEEFAIMAIEAIAALHEYHGHADPTRARIVDRELDKIVTVAPPPRWPQEYRAEFAKLPAPIRFIIKRREEDRDLWFQREQSRVAEARKKPNGESKSTEQRRTEHVGGANGAASTPAQ